MDYGQRRQHLKDLSEEQLKKRFWQLAEEVVEPLLTMSYNHTTPSIERSVLLRMGFNSLEAGSIVKGVHAHGLLGKGAGHVVYRFSQEKQLDLLEAGRQLAVLDNWDEVKTLMEGGPGRGAQS